MTDSQSSIQTLRQIFSASWITQGIWVAAELGIADRLVNGPLTAQELAEHFIGYCVRWPASASSLRTPRVAFH
jgi:hypothetical protein